MLRINRENLRNSHETPWLILDLVMLGILFVNLTWLIFDALYATDFVYGLLGTYFPAFLSAYDPVHNNFLLVDLVFIAIFFSEFCFRWVVAIVRKEHLRWYFFPFLHWYDIIGLIPTGPTRLFRFLRIFSPQTFNAYSLVSNRYHAVSRHASLFVLLWHKGKLSFPHSLVILYMILFCFLQKNVVYQLMDFRKL